MSADHAAGQAQMFAWIEGLPAQLAASGDFPGLAAVRPPASPPAQVLCCGMGGSAMPASLLADGWPGLQVPLLVHRDAGLPAWAGPETLVIACSHSGTTAETLDAVATARARGCRLAAVTGGGPLLATARGEEGGEPFPAVELPTGQPPRTVLGAALGGLLHLLHRFGLLADPTAAIAEACAHAAADQLARLDGTAGSGHELAATLARSLAGRFTVLFTSGDEAHGAGRRLLAQLQENAKAPGHLAAFPELNHNEIVGWNLPAPQRDRFALLILRGGDETTDGALRAETTRELLAAQFGCVHEVHAHGPDRLSRILGLIVFGDLVSVYLAALNDVDPVPIARIDTLKQRLAGRQQKGSR